MPTPPGSTNRGLLFADLRPAQGTGAVYVGDGTALRLVFSFSAPAWSETGQQPVIWSYRRNLQAPQPSLTVVAGPAVELHMVETVFVLPVELAPIVYLVRVQSADLVPDPLEPLLVPTLNGPEEVIVNGIEPAPARDAGDGQAYLDEWLAAASPDLYRASIKPGSNWVSLEHTLNHWRLEVRAPLRSAGAFCYQFVHPDDDHPLLRASFLLRLARTANVLLDGAVTIQSSDDPLISTVVVEDAVVALAEVPPQGSDLSHLRTRTHQAFSRKLTPRARGIADAVELAVGMVPVAGTLVDCAHVTYMAATGRNVWGETVRPDEVLAQGIFSVLGVVLDLDDAAKVLRGVSERLFPGAGLVQPNPGFHPGVAREIEERLNPYLFDGLRSLGAGDQTALLSRMDEYSLGLRKAGELIDTFEAVAVRVFEASLDSGLVPTAVYRDSMRWIHPAALDAFDHLPAGQQRRTLEAFDAHHLAGGTVATVSRVVDALDGPLRDEFHQAVAEFRALRLFNVFFDGFRVPILSRGYASYVSRGGKRNAVQWALAQRSGAFVQALESLLGRDFRKVLRDAAPEKYLQVDDLARQHFAALAGGGVHTYRELKRLNSGFGHLFEADHLLEKRFFKRPQFDDFGIDLGDFQAILVPKNAAVARQLGMEVHYNHLAKTQLLRRRIPHGHELFYSLQEIWDAYMAVFRHDLELGPAVFYETLARLFDDLSEASGETLVKTIQPASPLAGVAPK